jgi:hypothetical protein
MTAQRSSACVVGSHSSGNGDEADSFRWIFLSDVCDDSNLIRLYLDHLAVRLRFG